VVAIAPSILAADFARLAEEVARVEEAGATLLHVDVMDGHFVPNLTLGPPVVKALEAVTRLPLDVHVMVEAPETLLPALIDAGSHTLSVHVEACRHLHRTIQTIKDAGVRASVGLNPASPISFLHDILPELDMVLLMSVNPGFGGQAFIPGTLDKIRALKQVLSARQLSVPIEVEGGMSRIMPASSVTPGPIFSWPAQRFSANLTTPWRFGP
jgi:ribulose-phosphate 3-epimerase